MIHNIEQLQLDYIVVVVIVNGLPYINQKEKPEGIDVFMYGVGQVELLQVEVMQLIHECNTQLGQLKGQIQGEGCVFRHSRHCTKKSYNLSCSKL